MKLEYSKFAPTNTWLLHNKGISTDNITIIEYNTISVYDRTVTDTKTSVTTTGKSIHFTPHKKRNQK